MRKAAIQLCGLLVLVVSGCGGGGGTAAPPKPLTVTEQTLYSFGGISATDAMGPTGVLFQGSDGNFYGTTPTGGLTQLFCNSGSATQDSFYIGCGTVFKITPAGEETVLHLFDPTPRADGTTDGANPQVLIQGNDGNFYGTTGIGGPYDFGTVFKLTPEGVETILYSFTGGSDGCPAGGLIQGSDGNFYGTTGCFGTLTDYGTVFKLTPQGVLTTLYAFVGRPWTGPDGAFPVGQLVQGSDGNFYGVTRVGGLPAPDVMASTTCGTVFEVTPEGTETILHRFSGPDGCTPNGLIQGSDDNFYGTTRGGFGAPATAFKVTPEGVETTLYDLSADTPWAGLIQGSDGNFYGTTMFGGINFSGSAFQLTSAGVETLLYSFPKPPMPVYSGPGTNLVQGIDGNFYGSTYQGGAYNRGSFFKLVVE